MGVIDLQARSKVKEAKRLLKMDRQRELLTSLAEAAAILTGFFGQFMPPTAPKEAVEDFIQKSNALLIAMSRGYGWAPEKGHYALILNIHQEIKTNEKGENVAQRDFFFEGIYASEVLSILSMNNPDLQKIEPEVGPIGE